MTDTPPPDVHTIERFFWHAEREDGFLSHNARLGGGFTQTTSAIRVGNPDFVSPYGFHREHDPKEVEWERVRSVEFPDRPSRNHTLFAFATEQDALQFIPLFFPNETRRIVRIQLTNLSRVHIADARYLDCLEADWTERARQYWSGQRTNSPRLEAIIHGIIYLPDFSSTDRGVECQTAHGGRPSPVNC